MGEAEIVVAQILWASWVHEVAGVRPPRRIAWIPPIVASLKGTLPVVHN
jgi:hypothetical protein